MNKICEQCGLAANYLTCMVRYGTPPKSPMFGVSTWHEAKCDSCKRVVWVTEARDFYYPNFSLLSSKFKKGLYEKAK